MRGWLRHLLRNSKLQPRSGALSLREGVGAERNRVRAHAPSRLQPLQLVSDLGRPLILLVADCPLQLPPQPSHRRLRNIAPQMARKLLEHPRLHTRIPGPAPAEALVVPSN